jgi:glycerophosphoryl diester phosphodiesterase
MALTNPTIIGPISELTTSVRLQGQLAGATVTIFTASPVQTLLAKGVATSSDQRFPLLPGVHLSAAHKLFAMQDLGGDSSVVPGGDLFMGVQPKPQSAGDIGTVGFRTHPFECGRYMWVAGGIPGAEVQVSSGAQLLGSGPSLEGDARFDLTHSVPHTGSVTANQNIPGLAAGPPVSQNIDPLPQFPFRHLPAPVIQEPVRGCDSSIFVSNVFDGALVTMKRSSGSTDQAGFDLGALTLDVPPLKEADKLIIEQEVAINCERVGTFSQPVIVGPLQPVDPPKVDKPLCAGSTVVTVEKLRSAALVHISNNGKVTTGQAPPGAAKFDFHVPPLEAGTVTATQELCGIVSAASEAVKVDPHPDHIDPVTVVRPLLDCARNVSVINVHPGATLQVFAINGPLVKPISNMDTVYGTQAVISVAPFLHFPQDVFIMQWACSNKGVASPTAPVEKLSGIPMPMPEAPIFDGDKTVEILNTLPGAHVELLVSRNFGPLVFAGSTDANNLSPAVIQTTIPLLAKDAVRAQQFLCQLRSDPSIPVTVIPATGPRPFYVVGHNPNTIHDVKAALNEGANALEPDVNVFESNSSELSVSHSGGDSGDLTLVQYLQALHTIAQQHPQLALIVFDCKPDTNTAAHGVTLLNAIRTHLTFDTPLNIIISISTFHGVAMFDTIAGMLKEREGLMIDEENDPVAVANFFTGLGVQNRCYGNGNTVQSPVTSPNLRPSIEHACGIRAGHDSFKFIYEWTTDDNERMREFIRTGVDGMISDTPATLKGVSQEAEFASLIRFATRADNPFKQPNANYEVVVHTGDVHMGGTDANVTFTVVGNAGTISKVIDTSLDGRMERDEWNYVTIPGPDIGQLVSITVQRDNDGNGPDWFLDKIIVRSFRYGVSRQAIFNRWIDNTSPVTLPLT